MKWIELLDVLIRAFTSLVVLFLVTKMLGKKQVSQLSLFDYVIGISIGNFAAEMTVNLDSQIPNGLFAVVIFGFVAYLVSIITMKSITLRRFFMGVPTILIQNGKLLDKGLKKVKMDVNDLLEQCRAKGFFDISQINYAILEVNGSLSILPKEMYRPINVNDMNLKLPESSICSNVVIDQKIMKKNLFIIGKDEKWLRHELKIKGYKDLINILLVTVDINYKINVYEKNDNLKILNILE